MIDKVLIIDFDGPLFSDRLIRYDPAQRKPYQGYVAMPDVVSYWVMDHLAVTVLNQMVDIFPFQTVVSSSWKKIINREQCEDLFVTNGLNLKLADEWCTSNIQPIRRDGCSRASEIAAYINKYEIDDYLILDDPCSGSSLSEKESHSLKEDNIIMVNPDVGLGSYDINTMMQKIKKWANIPERPLW